MPNFRPPAFAYPGGKARLANRIVGMLPINAKRYVDVFAGRGNVFFAAASLHYDEYWLNDPITAKFFRALMSWDKEISIPSFSNKEDYDRYKKVIEEDPNNVNAILLEPYLSYSGGGYWRNGACTGTGGVSVSTYSAYLVQARQILKSTKPRITSLDWKEVFAELSSDDVAFLDPPYIAATSGLYAKSMDDHEELVQVLKQNKFRWLLTEYRHDLYVSNLGEPRREFTVPLCMEKSVGDNVGSDYRTECIWKNY